MGDDAFGSVSQERIVRGDRLGLDGSVAGQVRVGLRPRGCRLRPIGRFESSLSSERCRRYSRAMAELDLKARQLRAARICKSRWITQQQIAEAIGASQGQVSRILGGQTIRSSRVAREVFAYVESFDGVTVEMVRDNDELLEAVASVWDGSDAHAKALAIVIRSLVALSRQDG